MEYGSTAAVLIRNLEYKTREDKVTKPLRDDHGRIYGELNSSKLTKRAKADDGSWMPSILPFGRQAVSAEISALKTKGVLVEHQKRRGFYRVERHQSPESGLQQTLKNRLSPNAIELSPNATVVSSNAIKLSPNATVYSGQIERDRNPDRREMESDKEATELSPLARPVETSNFHESELKRAEGFYPDPATVGDSVKPVESSRSSAPAVKLPRFFEDEFPELMREVNENVQRLINARKTPIEPVHPDLLPFDLIIDPERLSWIENGLELSPLTNRPIDWSNFEEQIDIAVDQLEIEFFFRTANSKKDMQEFREHFKCYEGLSISMVRTMLERIADATELPAFRPSKKEKVDHHYFARIIKDLKIFNRYFEPLFRETFAPFINERGESRFEQGQRVRWWPVGEDEMDGDVYYPLCDSHEDMPEPFRSILEKAVAKEREKLLETEESFQVLGDAQAEGKIAISLRHHDLFSSDEINAIRSA
jgi:hypothetical protein